MLLQRLKSKVVNYLRWVIVVTNKSLPLKPLLFLIVGVLMILKYYKVPTYAINLLHNIFHQNSDEQPVLL